MQQKSELPEGWILTSLPHVVDINMGQSPPGSTYNDKGNGLPFFQGKADFTEYYPRVRVYCTEPKKVANEGAILLSIRAPVGPTNVADQKCAIGRGLAALTPREGIPTDFILHFFRLIEQELSLSGTGSTFKAINKKDLENIGIPLPPLSEQHRIVSAIDALFTRLDATNEKLDRVPEILKKFRQSVLAAACDGRLTEEWREKNPDVEDIKTLVTDYCKITESKKKSKTSVNNEEKQQYLVPDLWTSEYLENFIDIAGRIGWKGLKAEEYRDEGPLFLSAHNLSSSKYVDFASANHISEERYFESPEIMLKNGDILLVKDGSGIGKIGIVNDLPQEATVNSSLLVIHAPEIIVTDFLYYLLSGPEMQNLVKQRITGSATPHLFQKDIKKFLLKIPPLPEQHEIVRRVDALFAFADSIEAKVAVARERTEKLRQSILAKAFSGELVETEAEIAKREGREYESAEVLLERIKEERGKGK